MYKNRKDLKEEISMLKERLEEIESDIRGSTEDTEDIFDKLMILYNELNNGENIKGE